MGGSVQEMSFTPFDYFSVIGRFCFTPAHELGSVRKADIWNVEHIQQSFPTSKVSQLVTLIIVIRIVKQQICIRSE